MNKNEIFIHDATVLKKIKSGSGILPYIDHDVIRMPLDNNRYMAVVYEKPLGGRVVKSMDDKIIPLKENEFIHKFTKPIIDVLSELFSNGIVHRAIRPTNLFYMDEERTKIVLGDFLTVPPGYEQPAVCETIEMGMCIKEGKGQGKESDDMYSFGVTSLFLISGKNVFANLSDIEVLTAKIKKGSYASLAQDERIPVAVIELLRGVLVDNAEQRWTIRSVDAWMHGRRLNPLQFRAVGRSPRAFIFNEIEYYNAKELSLAFSRNWASASSLIENDKLDIFLRRGLDEKDMANAIANARTDIQFRVSDKTLQADLWLSYVCFVMDKTAPIRYKGVNFFLDGLGAVVAGAFLDDVDFKIVKEILDYDIITRNAVAVADSELMAKIKAISEFMMRPKLGYGMERVLYVLNPYIPCLSSFIASEYANDVSFVVEALENISEKADHKKWPVDKHIAAFVASDESVKFIDHLSNLNKTDIATSTSGMLGMLAQLQWNFGPDKVFHLSKWLGSLVTPLLDSYYSRERRAFLEKILPNLVNRGNLSDLYGVLYNDKEREKDKSVFLKSKREYEYISHEIIRLEDDAKARKEEYFVFGNQLASILSFSITIVTILYLLVIKIF